MDLVAFSQNKLGGVQNFYYNLLSHAPAGVFDITWIFEDVEDTDPKLPQFYGVGKEIIFALKTDASQTTYDMARRLSKLIPDRQGVILANFWHELVTLHLHRRPEKTIFFVCHDEGYVPLAVQFEFLIDVFIAHNHQYYEEMKIKMPSRAGDIRYIPHGVQIPEKARRSNVNEPLRIVIATRMQSSKGIFDLPVIDRSLKEKGVVVHWTVIGRGPEKEKLEQLMMPGAHAKFYAPASNDEVIALMQQQDIFILPSRLDGLPVSLLEAMSVGCVPVISAFNEGIRKVVTEDVGYVLPVGDTGLFAECISNLHYNRELMETKSHFARERIKENFNINMQAAKYFELFLAFKTLKKKARRKFRRYGGWLDHPIFPAGIRSFLRSAKKIVIPS